MSINNIDELKNFVFVGIISADNDEFGLSEDQKQEIISRHNESTDWSYILECMPEQYRDTMIRFFEKTDEHYENSIQSKTLESSKEGSKVC